MALNFPNNPTIGDTYVKNSVAYTWNGVKWASVITIKDAAIEGEHKVMFFDIDGTLLSVQFVEDGKSAISPTEPDRTEDGLNFVEWNNPLDNVTHDMAIGATYETIDGKTHLYMDIPSDNYNIPYFYMKKEDDAILTVDWGDGTTPDTDDTGTGVKNFSHTYVNAGLYIIKVDIASGKYSLGTTDSTGIFNNNNGMNDIYKLFMGSKVFGTVGRILYYSASRNIIINIPNTLDPNGLVGYCFGYCGYVTTIIIPSQIRTLPTQFTYQTSHLSVFCLPEGLLNIGNDNRYSSFTMKHDIVETVPLSVTAIGNHFFSYLIREKLIVPERYTTLGYKLFYRTRFNRVFLHSGITNIGSLCFATYQTITEIYCYAITPPGVSTDSFAIKAGTKIFVPSESVDAYKAATNWATWADNIFPIPE